MTLSKKDQLYMVTFSKLCETNHAKAIEIERIVILYN